MGGNKSIPHESGRCFKNGVEIKCPHPVTLSQTDTKSNDPPPSRKNNELDGITSTKEQYNKQTKNQPSRSKITQRAGLGKQRISHHLILQTKSLV